MKLTIRILRNEDGGYTAVCPTLPGCVSQGPTREQATDRLDEAIRGYIAAVNNFVPEKVTQEVTEVS
jgi:predicted RNase H-like HicB family nuclease